MKTFLKIVVGLGTTFGSIIFLYNLFLYYTYNGFGENFNFIKPEIYYGTELEELQNKFTFKIIEYEYFVENKQYTGKQTLVSEWVEESKFYLEHLSYNKTFPSLARFDNSSLPLHKAKVGMFFGICFALFFILTYSFSDVDTQLKIYTKEYRNSKK